MNLKIKNLFYLTLTLVTIVAGYIYLRLAYKVTDTTPFTQEIVIIVLGTLATIFITALLLNKQTAVEIEKEQNIMFLDLKTKTYERLLDLMETMSSVDGFSNLELTKLEFITHRLAIFASADVLNEYQRFLTVISQISTDGSFTNDKEVLSKALGSLIIKIREDLLNESTVEHVYTANEISKMITQNSSSSSRLRVY